MRAKQLVFKQLQNLGRRFSAINMNLSLTRAKDAARSEAVVLLWSIHCLLLLQLSLGVLC